ncbi:MAG: serine/threonine-protein phosphatase [Flavobacteriaceae bacterium]|nr:serine/threonine-protein phosphatase [Flavobacteriaceae bacterium]
MICLSYSHIGTKDLNEDRSGHNRHCGVVCDGVGGLRKGEVASAFVVEGILTRMKEKTIDSVDGLKTLVAEVEQELNALVLKDSGNEGMATTLAMVYLGKNGMFTGHIGDSRILIVKENGRGYWQTKDHSIVATMIALGEITPSAARNHPLKNQITNALIARRDSKKAELEVGFLSDLEAGDLLLICSDGVLETFDDQALVMLLLGKQLGLQEKLDRIRLACEESSKDNHTAILIELEQADVVDFINGPTDWTPIDFQP